MKPIMTVNVHKVLFTVYTLTLSVTLAKLNVNFLILQLHASRVRLLVSNNVKLAFKNRNVRILP